AIRADQVVGKQDVGRAAAGEHLSLGERGALVLGDARVQLQASDFARLVRLDVRPKPSRPAGDLEGTRYVLLDQFLEEQKAGAEDLRGIGNLVFRIEHGNEFLTRLETRRQ